MSGGGGYTMGDPDAINVPFTDDENVRDEELITDADKPGESPAERATRKQRRQERIQLKLQEGKQAKEELERERAEKQELRERLARLEGVVSATQRSSQNDNAKDPYEAELDAIYTEQQAAYATAQAELAAGKMTPERTKHFERVARDIESRRGRVFARREIAMTEPIRQQNQARQQWEQKYPEIYSHSRAYEYAEGRFKQRRALGDNITNQVVDEIMEEAKVQFKLGAKPAPTVSERARMSGTASSGGGGGSSKEPITLSRELRKIAIAAHGGDGVSDEDAIKRWTAKTGKRMRERKQL
jgi:hypothetical protein